MERIEVKFIPIVVGREDMDVRGLTSSKCRA